MNYVQRRRFLWLLLLVGLVLIALVVHATTLARMHFNELAHKSTAVARLRCLGSDTIWEKGEIWTVTKFEVVERHKGLLPGIVTVRMIGGSAGHIHSRVDGAPEFQPGEDVYLFLWGTPGEGFGVLGWAQGTFRIRRDPRNGVETVTQDSAETPVFDPQSREFKRSVIRNMPVGVFQEKLRKELGRMSQ
jgi:hypothetical protein